MTLPKILGTLHRNTLIDDAPLLVLGPSLGSAGETLWKRAAPYLQGFFSLLIWDLPGHGVSPKATDSFRLEDIAAAVEALVAESGYDRYYYAGVSIGGATGLALAASNPSGLLGAAIVCSGAKIGTEESWLDRAETVRKQGTSVLLNASAARWFAAGFTEKDPDIVGRLLHNLSNADDESYARCCEALAAFDAREQLAGITVPLIAIAGADDPATPPELSEEIVGGVPGAELSVVEQASHLAVAEKPKEVSELLLRFFLFNGRDR